MPSNAKINVLFRADLKAFSTSIANANRSLRKYGTQLTNTGKNLSVGLTAPILAFGAVSLKTFDTQAKAIAQVNAGLKSTGNAVGFTSQELQKMANELQNNTLFGDEEILKGATAQLLTFTNIAGQQFARTQVAALDLATRLDGDLKSASIQLGKALNDPIANLSALSRSGIQFSEDQKATIKTLAETNRLADAQTLILNELEKQYGGSAAAAAEAGTGGIKQLANILGDVSEEFGAIINEALKPFIAKIKEWAIAFKNLSPEVKKVIAIVGGLAAAIGPLLVGLGFLMTTVVPGLITAFSFLSATVLPAVVSGFNSLTAAILANPIGILAAAIGAIVYGLTAVIQKITPAVSKLKTFFNLVKSGGNHAAFVNYQLADQAAAMDEESKAAEAAATAQAKFNKEQQEAAKFTANLTAELKKQSEIKTTTAPTISRPKNKAITGEAIMVDIPNVNEDVKLAKQTTEEIMDDWKGSVSLGMSGIAEGFAVGFGNLISGFIDGSASMADVGGLLLTTIADIATQLGKAAIEIGTTALAIKLAFTSPFAAIAAGVALVALGTVIGNAATIPQGGGGATAFANGGVVYGPTNALIGEYAGASSNPEVVAPLDKLKSLIAPAGAQGVNIGLNGQFKLSGQDMLLMVERAEKTKSRNG